MNANTHYDVLGVPKDATTDDIVSQYRKLIRVFHPDQAGEAGERMSQQVNEAYDVLRNPDSRRDYDRSLAQPAPSTAPPSPTKPTAQPAPTREPRPSQSDGIPASKPHSKVTFDTWRPPFDTVAPVKPNWRQRIIPPGSAWIFLASLGCILAAIVSSWGVYFSELTGAFGSFQNRGVMQGAQAAEWFVISLTVMVLFPFWGTVAWIMFTIFPAAILLMGVTNALWGWWFADRSASVIIFITFAFMLAGYLFALLLQWRREQMKTSYEWRAFEWLGRTHNSGPFRVVGFPELALRAQRFGTEPPVDLIGTGPKYKDVGLHDWFILNDKRQIHSVKKAADYDAFIAYGRLLARTGRKAPASSSAAAAKN